MLAFGCFTIFNLNYAQFNTSNFPTNLGAQNNNLNGDTTQKDSNELKKVKPRYFPKTIEASQIWHHLDTMRFVDSQFLLNHRYTPNQRSIIPILQLGVPGSPHVLLKNQAPLGGFTLTPALNTSFNIDPHNFSFHHVGQPYTRFHYAQGDGRFTGLEALHTQNFSPTWNITLNYRSSINEDMYTGAIQDNLSRNLGIGSQLVSQDKRYEHQIILSWNRNRRLENGGFIHDTLFYGPNSTVNDPALRTFGLYIPSLNGAESFLVNTHHKIAQRYYLNNHLKQYLWHQWDYKNQRFTFKDKTRDSVYYGPNSLFQSNMVQDSTSLRSDKHLIGWGSQDTTTKGIVTFEGAYQFQNAHLRSQNKDSITQSVFMVSHGYLLKALFKTSQRYFTTTWHHQLTGYLSNNYVLEIKGNHQIHDSASLQFEFNHQKQSPNLYHSYFLNNHFDFRGNLPESHRMISTELLGRYAFHSQYLDFQTSIQFGNIHGEVRPLFNTIPVILNPYQYIQSNIELRYSIKNWMFFGSYHIQGNTFKEWNNLGMPTHFTRFGMSFQNSAFSNALIYRLGFDASYMSSYEAWIYRADTRQFYAHNQGVTLGNYPLLDVFFSARIKTIDLFFKYEHLNHWWVIPGINRRYESTLKYPIQPDRFRFGFIWHFWN
jgi:hypothetical protein